MIKIDEFNKTNLRIAKIVSIEKNKIKIKCGNIEQTLIYQLKGKIGDKIMVLIDKDKIMISIVNENIPIIPEKDIETGSKIR